MINISDNDKLLVFAPHPDDEILGCGGLMSKIKSFCGKVYVSLFTYGDYGKIQHVRKNEFENVMNFMNVDSFECMFSDKYHLRLDQVPIYDLIQKIESSIRRIKPTICAIPFPSFNQDHRQVYEACIAALRPPAYPEHDNYFHVIIYEYPQISWTPESQGFTPNLYFNIDFEIDKKIEAFNFYRSQQKSGNYAISKDGILSLAEFRGKEVSMRCAEAYMIKRGIIC